MATYFLCSPTSRFQLAHIFIFVYTSLFVFLPLSESVYFKIALFDYDSRDLIIYLGDARPSNGVINFNSVQSLYRVGNAKYVDAIQIWDGKSGELSDFTTHFTFMIDTLDQSSYGQGLAFYLVPVDFQIPPNSAGGFLGLFKTNYNDSSQNQTIVVEFDSFSNPEWDPPFEHVGINKNSIASANYTAWNVSMHSGEPVDAWVSYNGTTQILNLSWRYGTGNTSRETSLSYQVDLREVLPEWVKIGFSASTGSNFESHLLHYWEFNSSMISKDKSQFKSNKRKLALGLSVTPGVLILLGIVACTIFWSRHRKPTQKSLDKVSLASINDVFERVAAKRFSYSDLAMATNNFSDDRKLGQRGFGCVYKGYLSREGMAVAVKKISQGSKQGKKDYMTEVKITSSLSHRNLVRLIGWCHDQTQFLLVYELMPNGSLDSHLFGKNIPLDWDVRYKIVMGLASALLYLHEEWEQCVVHRDIKPSNIMLDSGFNVKLGDFGLARLMEHDLGPRTTGLAGTLGYMAPEYITTRKASKESDVYSFGVVALEIACGQKVRGCVNRNPEIGFLLWVWDLHGKGELLSGVDHMLNMVFDEKEVKCLMMVGLWCAHPDRSMRPSIRQAIQVLKFDAAVPNLPLKMPVLRYYTVLGLPEVSSIGATMTNTSIDLAR